MITWYFNKGNTSFEGACFKIGTIRKKLEQLEKNWKKIELII